MAFVDVVVLPKTAPQFLPVETSIEFTEMLATKQSRQRLLSCLFHDKLLSCHSYS